MSKRTFDKVIGRTLQSDPTDSLNRLYRLPEKQLELPFKPFTLEEVADITGAEKRNIDDWSGQIGIRYGCGISGLEYCQAFAIFVGQKWLDEGAPRDQATATVRFLCDVKPQVLEEQIAKGNAWPVPRSLSRLSPLGQGKFVTLKSVNPLAKRLDLRVLLAEFKHNIDKVFPKG